MKTSQGVKKSKVRTRIAPSPTGFLHVGTARTALFNYLFAKHEGGKFVLRIEDTDQERSDKKYEKDIIEGLKWLGIDWDEFYRQSERVDLYKKYLKKLIDTGAAYISQEKEGERKEVVRFKNSGKKIVFEDSIRGNIKFDTAELGDFVIAKSEDEPLYNFAVVVDDAETEISHVIRGEDHISNTPKQILLQEALDFKTPIYAHLPLILGSDKSKLSKRHGATSVIEYKEAGYLPEALFNFMALLGWNPGTEQEIFSREELIKVFSLDKVQKAGAIFDTQKLDWMNGEYIRKKSPRELLELASPFLGDFMKNHPQQFLEKIIALEQPRLKKLSELSEKADYFFKEPEYDASLLKWKNMADAEIKKSLETSKQILEQMSDKDFNKDNLEKAFLERAGKDRGELLWPLRVALSGRKASPGPFEIMEILGKAKSVARINLALNMLK